ncbi:uncharacterized protein LOC132708537 [Cylas formicarius]|uniref:uncharacterized protein LOC132708537 n=1 Tax=Cylas formicarius TaxID=197179 RepID=UPI002958BCB3|nr:uncharacterized protein LOC132708537 [Cylas formicarius]
MRYTGFKYNKNKVINKKKSTNPFAKMSYRQLQIEAQEMLLPANFKHKVLLALVIANLQNRQDIVNVILKSNVKQRRGSSSSNKFKTNPITQPSINLEIPATQSASLSHPESAAVSQLDMVPQTSFESGYLSIGSETTDGAFTPIEAQYSDTFGMVDVLEDIFNSSEF